ncbi:MAG: hypothetical protein IPM64_10175 [Phycisphaerales bacterium]|nr:hypothetical protein [Phycisphaerales bacterium]
MRLSLLVLSSLLVGTALAGEPYPADLLTVGPFRYSRIQFPVPHAGTRIPCGDRENWSYVVGDEITWTHSFMFREVDRDGNDVIPERPIDEFRPSYNLHGRTCVDGMRWFVWSETHDGDVFARIFDSFGDPLGPAFTVAGQQDGRWDLVTTASGAGRVVITFYRERGPTSVPPTDLVMRVYSPTGTLLSPLLPAASHQSPHWNEPSDTVVRDDGTIIQLFVRFGGAEGCQTFTSITSPGFDQFSQSPITGAGLAAGRFLSSPATGLRALVSPISPPSILVVPLLSNGQAVGLPQPFLSTNRMSSISEAPGGSPTIISVSDTNRPRSFWFDSLDQLIVEDVDITRPTEAPRRVGGRLAMSDEGVIWTGFADTSALGEPGQRHMTILRPIVPGDMTGDGRLTNFDIEPFVLALVDRDAYAALYPQFAGIIDALGDMDGDGVLTNFDIDPFVDALVNGP